MLWDYLISTISALETEVTKQTRELAVANEKLREEVLRHQKAAADLQEHQAHIRQLATIVESSQDAILSTSLDGTITSWNLAAEALFGYTSAEALGQPVTILIPIDQQPGAAETLASVCQGARVDTYEAQRLTKDGRLLDVAITLSPLLDQAGQVIGASKIIRDISDRKRSEAERNHRERLYQQTAQALSESQQWFHSFMIHAPLLAWFVNRSGQIEYANAAWFDFVGHTEATALGRPLDDLFPPELAAEYSRNNTQVLQTGQTLETCEHAIAQDGFIHTFLVRRFPVYEDSQIVAMGGIAIDVTEQKQAETTLRQQAETLQIFYESSPLLMGLVETSDRDILHLSGNPTTLAFFGVTAEILSNRWSSEMGVPSEIVQLWLTHYRQSQQQRRPIQFDYEHVTASGRHSLLATVSFLGVSDSGRPRFSYIMQDLTEQQQLEGEKAQISERLQESEQRYASLIAAVPVGIFRTDAAGQCVYVNEQWELLADMNQEDALGDRWAAAIHSDDRDRVFEAWTQAAQAQRTFKLEYRFQSTTGKVAWVYGQAVAEHSTTGELLGYVGTVTDITDRKQIEAERQQTEQIRRELSLLEQILEIVLAGYWDWNIPAHEEYLSPGFKRMFGYEDHELPNSPDSWQDIIFSEDLPRVMECFERHVSSHGQVPYYNEVRYRHKNGSTVWVLCSGQVIEWDDSGNPLRMIGCHIDITPHKQAEAALRQSETTNRALIQAIPDFLVRMRQDGIQLDVINEGSIHCLRPAGGDAIEQHSIFEIMPTAIAQERVQLAQRAIATGSMQRQEYAFYNQGQIYYEEARITPLWEDEVLVVVRDITERTRTEQGLRESEATKRALISAIPDLMVRIRRDGVYIDVFNRDNTNVNILRPDANIAGCHITEALPPDLATERMTYVHQALETGVIQQYEYQIDVRGTLYDEEARLIPLDENSVLAVIRDISEQKQREKRLQAAIAAADTANRAKSEFLANMSHEIRTPMNAVLGFTELLQQQVTDRRAQEYVQAIASSGKTLLALINDILDLSKIEAGRLELYPEPISIRALVQDIRAIFSQKAASQDLALNVQVSENVPSYLLLDEVRLRQILFNVVGNALKFTESGVVNLQVECRQVPSPRDTHIDLQITVQDTGIGIDPSQQSQIFEAFTQSQSQRNRKYSGTGLGLAITRRLVDLMDGQVTLESTLGQGSTFTFDFPNVELPAPEATKSFPDTTDIDLNQFVPARILIVDDVASNRNLLAGYFHGSPHVLNFAVDGEEALRLAPVWQPDVILMDLRMPRIDGLEASRRLKAMDATRHIPIVLVTASSQPQDEIALRDICEGFVRKPVSLNQLAAVLKPVLPIAGPAPSTEAQEFVPAPQSLTALSPEQRQLLIQRLTYIEISLWQPLQPTLAIEQIESFAETLVQLVAEIPYRPLAHYVQTLTQQLEDFDWQNLPETVAAFAALKQDLEDIN